jgi:hypothetical protein
MSENVNSKVQVSVWLVTRCGRLWDSSLCRTSRFGTGLIAMSGSNPVLSWSVAISTHRYCAGVVTVTETDEIPQISCPKFITVGAVNSRLEWQRRLQQTSLSSMSASHILSDCQLLRRYLDLICLHLILPILVGSQRSNSVSSLSVNTIHARVSTLISTVIQYRQWLLHLSISYMFSL